MRKTFRKAGHLLGDYGRFMADRVLGTFGATDVIGEDDYKTKLGKGLNQVGDVINPIVGKIGATALGGPMAGAGMGQLQQGVGAATAGAPQQPPQPLPYNPDPTMQQSYTPTFKYGGNMKRRYQTGGGLPDITPGLRQAVRTDDSNKRGSMFFDTLTSIPTESRDYNQIVSSYNQGITPRDRYMLNYEVDESGNSVLGRAENPDYTLGRTTGITSNPQFMTTPGMYNPRRGRTLPQYSARNPYLPKKADGGAVGSAGQFVDYNVGQSHTGPDEGIPVDSQGQPTAMSGGNPVALTEKGEVAFNGYVFSDTTKLPGNKKRTFSDEAKRIKNKYKFYLGDKLDKKDNISQSALERELDKLMMLQETIKGNTVHQDDVNSMMEEQMMAMEQQQMSGSPEEQAMMQEEQMMAQQGMGEAPMMRMGGRLPKLQGGGGAVPQFSNVRQQQQFLQGQGFNPGPIDNIMGPRTQLAWNDYMGSQFGAPSPMQQPNMGALQTGTPGLMGVPEATAPIEAAGDGWETYSGDISPWSMAPAVVGNLIGLAANKRPDDIRLGRMVPEQINLEAQRVAARNRATSARATGARRLRDTGLTPGAYMGNMQTMGSDIERNLGEQVGQSHLMEQTTNMQARQRAQEVGFGIAGQETMANRQLADQHRQQQLGYLGNMMNVPGQYMADRQRSMRDANWIATQSANYDFEQQASRYGTADPRRLFENRRFRTSPRVG